MTTALQDLRAWRSGILSGAPTWHVLDRIIEKLEREQLDGPCGRCGEPFPRLRASREGGGEHRPSPEDDARAWNDSHDNYGSGE